MHITDVTARAGIYKSTTTITKTFEKSRKFLSQEAPRMNMYALIISLIIFAL